MERNRFLTRVIPTLAYCLFWMTVGSGVGYFLISYLFNPTNLIALLIADLVFLVLTIATEKIKPLSFFFLFLFSSIIGALSFSPLILMAVMLEVVFVIPMAIGMTAFIVIIISLYVWITKKDFTHWGTWLLALLLLAIVLTILQIFIGLPLFLIGVDVFVVILFMAFLAYDMSSILHRYDDDEYISAALALFLDIMNILIRIIILLIRIYAESKQ